MRVAALVDETIGVSAYASREEVNRFLREGPALTAAHLAIQPSRAAELYATLKAMPGVASVSLREAMLASVRKTIVENIYISASMIVGFACVIAFGVIYNGARIALSERGRDLASLRVLGFSKGEVGAMLLGEQAVLTVASIPIGFLGGWVLSLWIARQFDSEVYRIPLVISGRTYAISFFVIAVAAAFTAALVQRRIRGLDLVEVLKTRE
jgi:putative ABC transport system permease protein